MAATALQDRTAMSASSHRWYDNGNVSRLERLPLFGDAMVQVARALTASLNGLAASEGEVKFRGVQAVKIDDLLVRRKKPSVFVMVQAPGWKTPLALQFDHDVVCVVLEALFGSGEEQAEISVRPTLSPVEGRIAEIITNQTCDALAAGFADILPSSFAAEAIRPKPDLSLLGKPATPMLIATLVLRALGAQVEIDVAVPQAALEAFSERLSTGPANAALGADPGWTEKLEQEVSRARMTLTARIDLAQMTLKAIAELRPGQVLACPPDVGQDVKLACGNGDLFRCELGQSNGFYTLRVSESLTTAGPAGRTDP